MPGAIVLPSWMLRTPSTWRNSQCSPGITGSVGTLGSPGVPWMRVSPRRSLCSIFQRSPTVARVEIEHVEAGGGAGRHADQLRGGSGEVPEFADPVGIGAGVVEAVAALGLGDGGPLVGVAREHRQAGGGQGERDVERVLQLIVEVGRWQGGAAASGARASGRSGAGGALGSMYDLTLRPPRWDRSSVVRCRRRQDPRE